MTRLTLKSALIGAGLAVAAISGSATTAQAEGFSFGITIGNGGTNFHHGYHNNRHGLNYTNRSVRRNKCTPRRALRKARRLGVHRAYVRRVGHRGVVIGGRFEGDRVKVRFNRRCRITRVAYR